MATKDVGKAAKLSEETFWLKAIDSLRKDGYKSIHSVYSSANEAFKKYFEGCHLLKTGLNEPEIFLTTGTAKLKECGLW